jgi:hypothetical protein
MRKVRREELLDHVTYGERREALRARAMAEKELRRVLVGEHLTFLFENSATVRYQVQEMMRVERIVREADVQHELDTYNELIGGRGELGCSLLIGIDDPAERDRMLSAWLDLPEHLFVRLADGRQVRARIDERQRGRGRLSSVQYLKFPVGGAAPVAVGSDHPGLRAETALTPEQRAALQHDLAEDA